MVVVAHPDDELLGMGATINNLKNSFDCNIHIVILGEGITSRDNLRDIIKREKELNKHHSNILSAKKILGYDSLSTHSLPDNRFDTVPLLDIIKIIEIEKVNFQPDVVFTHHGGDLNIDHQLIFQSVITAFRPVNQEKLQTIICFEIPSGTEWQSSDNPLQFVPNFFYEVNEKNLEAKINAMECYEFEKRAYPHPRSPEALKILASYRGITVEKKYIEAFNIIRHIQ